MKFLTFFLNHHLFALPLAAAREVNRMGGIRMVTQTPGYILGLINLHGLIAPVLNLKDLIRIEPSQLGPHARWIAIRHNAMTICLAVDELDRIIQIPREDIDPVPPLSLSPDPKYLLNCFRTEGGLVLVIAVGNLLTSEQEHLVTQLVSRSDLKTLEETGCF